MSQVAASDLRLIPRGNEWKACCPFHADRTPSFTIYAGDSRFKCFGCGAQGDVLDFLVRLHGVSLRDALEMLEDGTAPTSASVTRPVTKVGQGVREAEARAIWERAGPAAGTLAEIYLRSRGIGLSVPGSVRFARLGLGRRMPMPALVAAITMPTGEVAGIQRTYLRTDGRGKATLPSGKAKFSLGRVRGGAIRLGPAAHRLVITEGLEDGLTLAQQLDLPVWVAAGAGMLASMELPSAVREVIVGADADETGERTARAAATAIAATGRRARILRPLPPHKDFNAELMAWRDKLAA